MAPGRFLLVLAISGARTQVGRRRTSKEGRELIFRMVVENPTWGAPRIRGQLLMLGFDISERTISRWMRRAPSHPESAKRWLAFLRNHREAIAAMDFFTVPTITCGVLSCFFIIRHDRRRIGTSTSQCGRPACGLCSNCEKRFRLGRLQGSSSSIVMPNMGWRSPPRSDDPGKLFRLALMCTQHTRAAAGFHQSPGRPSHARWLCEP